MRFCGGALSSASLGGVDGVFAWLSTGAPSAHVASHKHQGLIAQAALQDILSRFNGCWSMHPILNEEGTHIVGTRAVLHQDILPAGMRPESTAIQPVGSLIDLETAGCL